MAVLWQILYGFILICGKCSLEGSEAVRISLETLKNVQGLPNKDSLDAYSGNSELKNDQKEISLDENLIGLGMNTLEEDAGYQDCEKSSHPVSFIYHKTLKKIEGKPIKVKDENGMLVDSRIRVSPLGFEPFQHLDFPIVTRLSELNNLNEVGGSRTKNNGEQEVSVEKLKGFLKEAIWKSNRNSVSGRESGAGNRTKRSDQLTQQRFSNKSELMKFLVAAYPLQVSLSQGGLLKHFLEKGSDRKFRPEEFISGISSDPSFSSTNEGVAYDNNSVAKQTDNETSYSKSNNTLDRTSPRLIENNSSSLENDANLTLDKNSIERIHQSAEETVFKNVLNELISDIPSNLGLSTVRSVENIGFINEILKDTDRIKEIESRVKSAKQAQEDSTSNFKDSNPCMKIRVKNGPVTLTFQSEARKGTTRKPYTDPSNIPVFKINADKLDLNKSNIIDTNSLLKNVLSGLTDELNGGELSKGVVEKGNASCYYSGNEFEKIATSYLMDRPHMMENKSKTAESVNEKDILETNCSKNATKSMNHPVFIPVQDVKLANYTDSRMKTKDLANVNKLFDDNPEDKSTPKANVSCIRSKIETYKPSGTVAVACPLGSNCLIFPNYLNGVHRFGPSKHLFLTRTGSGSYQFSHDADRLRLAAHLSRSNPDSRCKYVPKLYYNDLVVSKGLVGQHPPKDDSSSAVLSDSTLKKMEMLNILKFYLDSLTPERNYTMGRNKESFIFNPMLKNNRKYFIKL